MVDIVEAPPVAPSVRHGDRELTPARVRIAAVCALGLALAAVLPFSVVWAARGPMMLELGWGADQLRLSNGLMMWAGALGVWPVGLLIDRYGARVAVTMAAVAIAVVGLLLPFVSGFWQVCALFALLGVCSGFGLAYSKIIAAVFIRSRGSALGIFAAEGAALSVFLPLAAGRLVQESGWRAAFTILGVVVLALAPLLWFGLSARNSAAESSPGIDPLSEGVAASGAVRSRAFWLVVAAGLVTALVGTVVLAAFGSALIHRGFQDVANLRGTPAVLMALLAGPICAGVLLDRTRSPIVGVGLYAFSAAICVVSAVVSPSFGGKPLLLACFVLGAFTLSAQAPMVGYLFSRYFGLRSFATLCSLQTFIQAVVVGVAGSAATQAAGPGDVPMIYVAGTIAPLVAALLYLLLPAYRYGAPHEPAADPAGQPPRSFRTWWSRAPS